MGCHQDKVRLLEAQVDSVSAQLSASAAAVSALTAERAELAGQLRVLSAELEAMRTKHGKWLPAVRRPFRSRLRPHIS